MIDHSALLRACAECARGLVHGHDVDAMLSRLAEQVTDTLAVSGASVWLGEEGRLRLVAATGPEVMAVEAARHANAAGPCYQAWRSGAVVVERDLARSERWPAYAAAAGAAGQRAVASVPMTVGDRCIGAVSAYHTHPYEWPQQDLEGMRLLADLVAGHIVLQRLLEHRRLVTAELQQALDSRVLIEQAKGILAERHGTDVDTAFDHLRGHARSYNRALHDVAREVVEGRLDPMAGPPTAKGG